MNQIIGKRNVNVKCVFPKCDRKRLYRQHKRDFFLGGHVE